MGEVETFTLITFIVGYVGQKTCGFRANQILANSNAAKYVIKRTVDYAWAREPREV